MGLFVNINEIGSFVNINVSSLHSPLTGPENLKENDNFRYPERLRKTITVRNFMIYFEFMILYLAQVHGFICGLAPYGPPSTRSEVPGPWSSHA